ncbi:zinc finger protein 70-like [Toxorhynchites rutilus septentrionalis]|uniref:zinc finger protein 70-like n=1 Tax=Toxorhynchites rutilus septentrionalis TaxID=329112 RepID=UPI002478E7EC|nr:zinc finger protein 70-like [Toxorhynchites rutilus septentrionalis]
MQMLGDHEKVHIDDRYNYGACGTKCNSKSGLRNHLAKNGECDVHYQHSKLRWKRHDEEFKEHECEVCGKKYRHRKSMLEHRNLQFGETKDKQTAIYPLGGILDEILTYPEDVNLFIWTRTIITK